ncbi:MAG: glycosyltransferase family 1 protein [Chlorobi bacterium]|nr:glycosyltransferase family 1 protein [Chlorobiota bacterium]
MDWWLHNPSSEKRWVEIYARQGHRILFINSIGVGLPNLGEASTWKRGVQKLSSLARWLKHEYDNLFILSPLIIPLWSNDYVQRFNLFILDWQIRYAMKKAGMTTPDIVTGIPTAAPMINRIEHRCLIYYVMDFYSYYYENMSFSRIKEHDEMLVRSADAVVCASLSLSRQISRERSNVVHIPHGVDAAFLDETPRPEPAFLRNIPRPRFTYWGQMECMFDHMLIAEMAQNNPSWHFILIGRKTHVYPRLEGLSNVHFFPSMNYEALRSAGEHSDVLLMPWQESAWILHSCPIKYREYLAIGKPIVSVPIMEVEEVYPGAAYIASGVEEWQKALKKALDEQNSDLVAYRKNCVKDATVEAAAASFLSIIEKCTG